MRRGRRKRGVYGFGTARERTKNRWQIRYWVDGEDGRREETITAYSEADALETIRERQKKALTEAAQPTEEVQKPKVTMGQLFDLHLAHIRRENLNDYDIVKQRMEKHLYPRFKDRDATTFTTADATAYIDARLGAGAARGTINRETSPLRHSFKLGIESELIDKMPKIKHLKESGNERQGFLEYEQYLTMLRHLPKHQTMLLCFATHTGIRKGELLKFRWEWMNWNDMIIVIPGTATKNKKEHVIPVYGQMIGFIKQAWTERNPDCPYIFQFRGNRLKNIREGWEAARVKAGLPELLFHDMRRTAARFMERGGVPRSIIKHVGGWKTDEMLNRYLVACGTDAIEAGKSMTDYFANLEKKLRDKLGPRPIEGQNKGQAATALSA